MEIVMLIIAALIIFFIVPKKQAEDESKKIAADIAREFGDVEVECIEFRGKKDSDISSVYVLFEGNHHADPKYRYRILEKAYKSDTEKERNKKREYVLSILRNLPYRNGSLGIGGSVYQWDNFLEDRAAGKLLKIEEMLDESWERNKYRYQS